MIDDFVKQNCEVKLTNYIIIIKFKLKLHKIKIVQRVNITNLVTGI